MGIWCPIVAAVLHVHNGVYYGRQAIANYAKRAALAKAERESKKGK